MLHHAAQNPTDAEVRSAFGPLSDRLMEAVDSYIPTPDATENPPPSGG